MRWSMVHVRSPIGDGPGAPLDRLVRDVATSEVVRELDARLARAGVQNALCPSYLAALIDRTRALVDSVRAIRPLDPDEAEHYVAAAVDEVRTSGWIVARMPPPTVRRP